MIIETEYLALKREVAESKRDLDDTNTHTHTALVGKRNILSHKPSKTRDADVIENEVDIKQYALDRIVGRTQRNERLQYVVRSNGHVSKDARGKHSEHLHHHVIARYLQRIGKKTTTANVQASK